MDIKDHYNLVVAGAGLAGILFAARYCSASSSSGRILLLDKEPVTGGRLASGLPEEKQATDGSSFYPSGLSLITPCLFDEMICTLAARPEQDDSGSDIWQPLRNVSVLTGQRHMLFSWDQWGKEESVRIFGTGAAVKEWPLFEELLQCVKEQQKDQSFARAWKHGQKSAAVCALSAFLPFCGIPEPLKASVLALTERYQRMLGGFYKGPWTILEKQSLERQFPSLEIRTACPLVQAQYQDGLWYLETGEGLYTTPQLVAAQHPLELPGWLDQSMIPVPVLHAALRSRPASVVTLTLKGQDLELPADLTFIPSEGCYALNFSKNTIILHALINYEQSLDAPSVVKAIRRLRRAGKKLVSSLSGAIMEHEHLALASVGWSCSALPGDRKMKEALDADDIQARHLLFCGEAYGSSWNPDENLIRSVASACQVAANTSGQEML
ncbi:MAG: NAD(P)/FAD-dependent oxidoreductase [Deltaproteobacteria bacterium]|nr:NAD(P)/FAD-dependent oxidoreductase [Deltaproteobacteria bacterium]